MQKRWIRRPRCATLFGGCPTTRRRGHGSIVLGVRARPRGGQDATTTARQASIGLRRQLSMCHATMSARSWPWSPSLRPTTRVVQKHGRLLDSSKSGRFARPDVVSPRGWRSPRVPMSTKSLRDGRPRGERPLVHRENDFGQGLPVIGSLQVDVGVPRLASNLCAHAQVTLNVVVGARRLKLEGPKSTFETRPLGTFKDS